MSNGCIAHGSKGDQVDNMNISKGPKGQMSYTTGTKKTLVS